MAQWLAPFFMYHSSTQATRATSDCAGHRHVAVGFCAGHAGRVCRPGGQMADYWRRFRTLSAVGLTYYRWWRTDRLVRAFPFTCSTAHRSCGAVARLAKDWPEVNLGGYRARTRTLSIGAGTSIGNAVNLGERPRRRRLAGVRTTTLPTRASALLPGGQMRIEHHAQTMASHQPAAPPNCGASDVRHRGV